MSPDDIRTTLAGLLIQARAALDGGNSAAARTALNQAANLAIRLPPDLANVAAEVQWTVGDMLRQVGQPDDAASVLLAAGDNFRSLGDMRSAGEAFYYASHALEEAGELASAAPIAQLAALLFTQDAAALDSVRTAAEAADRTGMALKNAGRLSFFLRQWTDAAELFEWALTYLSGVANISGASDRLRDAWADCHGSWGECLYRMGAYAAAAPHLQQAVEVFDSLGNKQAVARVTGILASSYEHAGDTALAAEWGGRALAAAVAAEDAFLAGQARQVLAWSGQDTERRLAAQLPQVTGRTRADLCMELAVLRFQAADYPAAQARLTEARAGYAQVPDVRRELARCDLLAARIAELTGRPDEALELANRAATAFGTGRFLRDYVEAATLIARLRAATDRQAALVQACMAVAVADDLRQRLGYNEDRELWSTGPFGTSRSVALDIASGPPNGNPWYAAELIESGRAQTQPAAVSRDPGVGARSAATFGASASPAGGERPLGTIASVAVNGTSLLHQTRQNLAKAGLTDAGPAPIELLTASQTLAGGGDVWWLGSWLGGNGDVLWESAVGARDAGAGSHDMSAESPLFGCLKILYQSLPFQPEGETYEDLARRMTQSVLRDPATERKLAGLLGTLLLPQRLRDLLRDTKQRVRLVVAPDWSLSYVPWGLLAIDDQDTRLLERADVLLAPAVYLIDALERGAAAGHRQRGGPGPLAAAAVDPDGDLSAARSFGQRLVPAAAVHAGAEATVTAFLAPLQGAPRGRPGLAVFAGHSRSSLDTRRQVLCFAKSEAALSCPMADQCCGGGPLAAERLFADPDIALPGRVFLAACSSSGSMLAGSAGEWLGLAPAMLWAGARLVIAANWPTIDNSSAAEFEAAVVNALLRERDPVGALHDLQASALRRWRDGDLFAAPLYWAGYSAIGFRAC
jgi:tetratricopeptide (TPR) repeat protein/CHAT domain-containing protein